MDFFEEYLYLKKSKLPNAGTGLFTKTDIPKGKIIVEYKGKLELWKNVKESDGYNGYIFKLNSKYAIDGFRYKKSLARYANDARGFEKIIGYRNNSEYLVKKNQCFVSSIRKIYKGEEILVPYGKDYWDLMKTISGKKK